MSTTTYAAASDREAARRLFESVHAFGPTVTVLKPALDRIEAGVTNERRWSKAALIVAVATFGVQVAILWMLLSTPRPQEQTPQFGAPPPAAVLEKLSGNDTKEVTPKQTSKPPTITTPAAKVPEKSPEKPTIPAKPEQPKASPPEASKETAPTKLVPTQMAVLDTLKLPATPSATNATKLSDASPVQPNTGAPKHDPSYQFYRSGTQLPPLATTIVSPCPAPCCCVFVRDWSLCGPAYILVNP